jgi:hypothetical protein
LLGGDLPALEHQQGRDAPNAVLRGDFRVLIDVQLDDLDLSSEFGGDFLERGRNHAAGAAPLGPEIHHDRLGGVENLRLECVVGNRDWRHEGLLFVWQAF